VTPACDGAERVRRALTEPISAIGTHRKSGIR
jgi:hypothetical protein